MDIKSQRTIAQELLEKGKTYLDKSTSADTYFKSANLFTILKMENKEVSAHSAFLYYILKPFKIGSQRNVTSLKLFVKHVLNISEKFNFYDIEREVVSEFGRIDFVIHCDRKIIALELKIWHYERENQLKDYQEYVKLNGGNEDDVYFLTIDGKRSVTMKGAHCISMKHHIKNWLNELSMQMKKEFFNESTDYCSLLNQYSYTIDKLTLENKEDKEMLNLIKNSNDLKVIKLLEEAKILFLEKILSDFFIEMDRQLNEKDFSLELLPFNYGYSEYAINNYYKAKTYPSKVYEVKLTNELARRFHLEHKNHKILFFIEISRTLYVGFAIRNNNGDTLSQEEVNYYNNIFRSNSTIKLTSSFINWNRILINNEVIDFKDLNDGYYSLIDENIIVKDIKIKESQFKNIKSQIIELQIKLWNEILNNLKDL